MVDPHRDSSDRTYGLDLSDDGLRVRATIGSGLVDPTVQVGDAEYRVEYADAGADDAPVVIRNRPRLIIFNTKHRAHAQGDRARKYSVSLALELAFLNDSSDATALYDQMIDFLEHL